MEAGDEWEKGGSEKSQEALLRRFLSPLFQFLSYPQNFICVKEAKKYLWQIMLVKLLSIYFKENDGKLEDMSKAN